MADEKYIPQTQFSICKIDIGKVNDTFKQIKVVSNEDINITASKVLIKSVCKIINGKKCLELKEFSYEGFYGVIFKTEHIPAWQEMLAYIINNCVEGISSSHITNVNVSYILLYPYKDGIYAMTGGYGNHYISRFIQRNYGLYLIPKIVKKDDPIVKRVLENNTMGNRLSTQRANRANTSISVEQDLSSIYKELSIEVDTILAKELGISIVDSEKDKKIGIDNKDAIIIRRSFSIEELKKVISKLYILENKKSNFAMNYMITTKKSGIKDSELVMEMQKRFKEDHFENFTIVGDDYCSYYSNATRYVLSNENDEVIIDKSYPINLSDVIKIYDETYNRTLYGLSIMIKKWKIVTYDNAGNMVLYPTILINAMQGYFEFSKIGTMVYLLNGGWYVYDTTFKEYLNVEFQELFLEMETKSNSIIEKFNLKKNYKNEDTYNKSFLQDKSVIFAHTTLKDNMEIADLIFYDENNVYLMHNKGKFNGEGARDLINQILVANEYLTSNLGADREKFLNDYYIKLCNKVHKEQLTISLSQFSNLFNKRICYIAGFMEGYKKSSQSLYAKFLVVEMNKKFHAMGRGFMLLGIK